MTVTLACISESPETRTAVTLRSHLSTPTDLLPLARPHLLKISQSPQTVSLAMDQVDEPDRDILHKRLNGG